MNRYVGNSGMVERIPEPEEYSSPASTYTPGGTGTPNAGRAPYRKPPGQRSSLLSGLGSLFSKAKSSVPDLEDIILLAVLYLLYRESGDIEFLIIAGAMLFL